MPRFLSTHAITTRISSPRELINYLKASSSHQFRLLFDSKEFTRMDELYRISPTQDHTTLLLMLKSYTSRNLPDRLIFFYQQITAVRPSLLRYVIASLISSSKLSQAFYETQKHSEHANAVFYYQLLLGAIHQRDLSTALKVFASRRLDLNDKNVRELVFILFNRACYHGRYDSAQLIYKWISKEAINQSNIQNAILDLYVNTKSIDDWYLLWKSGDCQTPWIRTLDAMILQVDGLRYDDIIALKPMSNSTAQSQLQYS